MSYARFGCDDSDVYVFLASSQHLECCGCIINGTSRRFDTTDLLIAHLDKHREKGHVVPDATYEQLRADQAENDEWIRTGNDEVLS